MNITVIDDKWTFLGHTHVYNLEGKHINPGSVGFPRSNKEHTVIQQFFLKSLLKNV